MEVTKILYQVSAVNGPGAYVAPLAPAMPVKVVPSVLFCHCTVSKPSPAGAAEVRTAGVSPLQIVCVPLTDPGVMLLTVTFMTACEFYTWRAIEGRGDLPAVPGILCKYASCIGLTCCSRDIVEVSPVNDCSATGNHRLYHRLPAVRL